MGMFDSVMVPCPNCGRKVEFQSKAGNCGCDVYDLATAPVEIVHDILNAPEFCRGCRRWFAIVDPDIPPGPPPRPNAAPALLKPIPETQEQVSTGRYYWPWDAAFSFDDIAASSSPVTNEGAGR